MHKKVSFHITEYQLEELEELFRQVKEENLKTGHAGAILMQPKRNGMVSAMYFPYDEFKYIQAVVAVARKGKAIEDFLKTMEGESFDDNDSI